jgi:hypothetical protein
MNLEWVLPADCTSGQRSTALFAWRYGDASLHMQPLVRQQQPAVTEAPKPVSEQEAAAAAGAAAVAAVPAVPAGKGGKKGAGAAAAKAAAAKESSAAAGAAAVRAGTPQEQGGPGKEEESQQDSSSSSGLITGARSWALPHGITCSARSASGDPLLATGHTDGSVLIWDAVLGTWVTALARAPAAVTSLCFVPAGASTGSQAAAGAQLLVSDAAGNLQMLRQTAGAAPGVLRKAWEVLAWSGSSSAITAGGRSSCSELNDSSGLLLGRVLQLACAAGSNLVLLLVADRQGQMKLTWLDVATRKPAGKLLLPAGLDLGIQVATAAGAGMGKAGQQAAAPQLATAMVSGRLLLRFAVGTAKQEKAAAGTGGAASAASAVLLDYGDLSTMVQQLQPAAQPGAVAKSPGPRHMVSMSRGSAAGDAAGRPPQGLSPRSLPAAGSSTISIGSRQLKHSSSSHSQASTVSKSPLRDTSPARGIAGALGSSMCSAAHSTSPRPAASPAPAPAAGAGAGAGAGQLSASTGSAVSASSGAGEEVARSLAKLQGSWGTAPALVQHKQLKSTASAVAKKLEAVAQKQGGCTSPGRASPALLGSMLSSNRRKGQG